MENPFKYTDDNKRYQTYNYFLKHKFGGKVFKVSLNAGFTCPNIDGTKGVGGCVYCSDSGSGDFAGNPTHSLIQQFNEVKEKMHKKWPEAKYIAYFQAHTNTYAPVEVLREKYEAVLGLDNVVGLSIATRPDCLPDDVLDYLEELSKRTYLTVELGLQSANDRIGESINRCHTFQDFLDGYHKLRERGINVCVHIINGLPGERPSDMIETVRKVSMLEIHCIKIHLLHVIENTVIAQWYKEEKFDLMARDAYVNTVCDQLEILAPTVVIQRLTGDGDKKTLIGPMWSLKKFVVMNEIDKEMARRGSWQGKYYKKQHK